MLKVSTIDFINVLYKNLPCQNRKKIAVGKPVLCFVFNPPRFLMPRKRKLFKIVNGFRL